MTEDPITAKAMLLKLDMMSAQLEAQLKQTQDRLMRVMAGLSVVGRDEPRKEETPVLPPLTRAQAVLLRLGFARFRWFRRRVGGRWCYRRCWLNDYPHSSSTVCVHRWERHPSPTMGDDILEVEQYDSSEFPVARLVDRT